jgi:hypothetical protein
MSLSRSAGWIAATLVLTFAQAAQANFCRMPTNLEEIAKFAESTQRNLSPEGPKIRVRIIKRVKENPETYVEYKEMKIALELTPANTLKAIVMIEVDSQGQERISKSVEISELRTKDLPLYDKDIFVINQVAGDWSADKGGPVALKYATKVTLGGKTYADEPLNVRIEKSDKGEWEIRNKAGERLEALDIGIWTKGKFIPTSGGVAYIKPRRPGEALTQAAPKPKVEGPSAGMGAMGGSIH